MKTLVAYASRKGSTAEVAEVVGQMLTDERISVDVRHVSDVLNVMPYDAVVVGSPIRAESWLPEAVDFVTRNRFRLGLIPIAYFTVCLTLTDNTPSNRLAALGYIRPVRTILEPVSIGLFPGTLDPRTINLIERTMVNLRGFPPGDHRNWEEIAYWVADLRATLLERATRSSRLRAELTV